MFVRSTTICCGMTKFGKNYNQRIFYLQFHNTTKANKIQLPWEADALRKQNRSIPRGTPPRAEQARTKNEKSNSKPQGKTGKHGKSKSYQKSFAKTEGSRHRNGDSQDTDEMHDEFESVQYRKEEQTELKTSIGAIDNQLPSKVRRNFRHKDYTVGEEMKAFIKDGKIEDAEKYMRFMEEKNNQPPSSVIYNMLLNAYCTAGRFKKVNSLFKQMSKNNRLVNHISYSIMLKECRFNKTKTFEDAAMLVDQAHDNIYLDPKDEDASLYNGLIHVAIEKSSNVYDTLVDIFEMMKERKIKRDSTTYSLLLKSLIKEHKVDEAMDLLRSLKKYQGNDNNQLGSLLAGAMQLREEESIKTIIMLYESEALKMPLPIPTYTLALQLYVLQYKMKFAPHLLEGPQIENSDAAYDYEHNGEAEDSTMLDSLEFLEKEDRHLLQSQYEGGDKSDNFLEDYTGTEAETSSNIQKAGEDRLLGNAEIHESITPVQREQTSVKSSVDKKIEMYAASANPEFLDKEPSSMEQPSRIPPPMSPTKEANDDPRQAGLDFFKKVDDVFNIISEKNVPLDTNFFNVLLDSILVARVLDKHTLYYKVFEYFEHMKQLKILPDSYTFLSLAKACHNQPLRMGEVMDRMALYKVVPNKYHFNYMLPTLAKDHEHLDYVLKEAHALDIILLPKVKDTLEKSIEKCNSPPLRKSLMFHLTSLKVRETKSREQFGRKMV